MLDYTYIYISALVTETIHNFSLPQLNKTPYTSTMAIAWIPR